MAKNPDPEKVVKRLQKLRKEPPPHVPALNINFSEKQTTDQGIQTTNTGLDPKLSISDAMKLKFIDELKKCFPNYTLAAKLAGASRSCFMQHLTIDKVFRAQVQDVIDECVDALEAQMLGFGMSNPKNFMDRIALARAYRPSRFDPNKRVDVTIRQQGSWRMEDAEANARLNQVAGAVDAEIVRDQYRAETPTESGAVGLGGQPSSTTEASSSRDEMSGGGSVEASGAGS